MTEFNPWDEYARLQKQADNRQLGPRSWAADEQAEEYLNAIALNGINPESDATASWLRNLAINRASKHRFRGRLLQRFQHDWPEYTEPQDVQNAEVNESMQLIQDNTTGEELSALLAIAGGDEYSWLAREHNCSESAFKVRIFRCRKRLRSVLQADQY